MTTAVTTIAGGIAEAVGGDTWQVLDAPGRAQPGGGI